MEDCAIKPLLTRWAEAFERTRRYIVECGGVAIEIEPEPQANDWVFVTNHTLKVTLVDIRADIAMLCNEISNEILSHQQCGAHCTERDEISDDWRYRLTGILETLTSIIGDGD